jgi:hypothetical protein
VHKLALAALLIGFVVKERGTPITFEQASSEVANSAQAAHTSGAEIARDRAHLAACELEPRRAKHRFI